MCLPHPLAPEFGTPLCPAGSRTAAVTRAVPFDPIGLAEELVPEEGRRWPRNRLTGAATAAGVLTAALPTAGPGPAGGYRGGTNGQRKAKDRAVA